MSRFLGRRREGRRREKKGREKEEEEKNKKEVESVDFDENIIIEFGKEESFIFDELLKFSSFLSFFLSRKFGDKYDIYFDRREKETRGARIMEGGREGK